MNAVDPAKSYYVNNATDSASSGTAMATDVKTIDGSIGVDYDGVSHQNVVEIAESLGKATGVISSVPFSHATPAAFVAHNPDRNDYEGIGQEMLYDSAVDVIMGCSAPDFNIDGTPADPLNNTKYAGGDAAWADIADDGMVTGADADDDGAADVWTVIRDQADFQALATDPNPPTRVLGIPKVNHTLQLYRTGYVPSAAPYTDPFIPNIPTLAEMAQAAINVLSQDEDGFFLMIEGGAVDWANQFGFGTMLIEEQMDFNNAVQAVVDWVEANSSWEETLVIVTADHETGYIWGPGSDTKRRHYPIVNNGAGNMPDLRYNLGFHSNSLVPLYAKGPGADLIEGLADGTDPVYGTYIDNTDIFNLLKDNLQ